MTLLTLRNVTLSLGNPPLLEQINLQVARGERLCLVGRNGAGKSTLLRLIAGMIEPDDGTIVRAKGVRVAMLEQDIPRTADGSVFHVVSQGLGEMGELLGRYHELARDVAEGREGLDALEHCQHALEAAGGWALNRSVETVLSRLSLDPDAQVATLSGGIMRRVLLARALVSEPDLLLLDEPTNHLDIDAITWLEEFLSDWPGALLFITHDRAFLRRLATRIIELDRGRLRDYPGEYDNYIARKSAEQAAEEKQQARFDKRLAQEETWIRQGIKARRTRNEGRARRLMQMREERRRRRERAGQARMSVQQAERSGKLVVETQDVSFRFQDRTIIRGLTTTILRGDKVGIVGPNGSGKTTLLRLLLGKLEPTGGTVRRGTGLEVAYFDQARLTLDPDKTVQDNAGGGREQLTIHGKSRHVISYLQDFLFTAERARQPVHSLSGGERNRLLLARLFALPSNVLVLDEPTNDLDAETLELLEERILDYEGTVLLVSHDRAFLNNIATTTLAFEGGGTVNEYVGGYDDWLRQRPQPVQAEAPGREGSGTTSRPSKPKPDQRKKLSYNDQRELDGLPERIETLEAERDALHARMCHADFYQQEPQAIAAAQSRLAELDASLARAYQRWEELEASQD